MSFRRLLLDSETAAALVRLTPGETLAFMGSCPEPRCRRGVRLDLEGITIFGPDSSHFPFGIDREPPRDFTVPAGSRWIGTGGYLTSFAGDDHRCPEHGSAFRFQGLRPILVTTSACGQSCEEATGAECKCSCGGANHGVAA